MITREDPAFSFFLNLNPIGVKVQAGDGSAHRKNGLRPVWLQIPKKWVASEEAGLVRKMLVDEGDQVKIN